MISRLLSFYTRYFVVWVVLFGLLAYLLPEPFAALGNFKLTENLTAYKLFFSLTMFGIGAILQIDDFKRIFRKPIIILIGSSAQFSIMPLGAFLAAKLFGLPPAIAAGLILTGSAPGAMASNVMSYVAKADTAYSVSLTTVSTLLCPLITPALTFLLASSAMKVSFWAMVLDIVCMVILPLFAGFGVRHYFKKRLNRILPVFPAISVTFIIFICASVIAVNKSRLPQITGLILASVVLLNVYGMTAGYGVGALFRMTNKRKRTLAIEIGMQNAGLGVVLAKEHIGDEATIPAATFVFVCIITASIMAALWQKTSPVPPAE
ncbi:MAG: bile acid:sodium symporter family protein [Planctomycetota bacterium]|jgi:BASS family bile acid:Na+ symporter